MRIWERRLLRDFHVVSVAGAEEAEDGEGDDLSNGHDSRNKDLSGADRFRKLASVAVAMNSAGISNHAFTGMVTPKGRTIKPL